MTSRSGAASFLAGEAESLLSRLDELRSFLLTVPMVPAVAASTRGIVAIEDYLVTGRRILRDKVSDYLRWIRRTGCRAPVSEQQRRLTFLKLEFNAVLDQLDIFADALIQRAEQRNGLWLAGLDAVATDALTLEETFFTPPPLITHLDRGHGAAIRRARTRLPGGGKNPVALIRVPRERMVGGGIGASLIHEVGHQAAALLDLNESARLAVQRRALRAGVDGPAWELWARWISEIVADLWAVAHLGVGATIGLIGVVSLPRAFVFRMIPDDPHPFPWIRVRLSCAFGRHLFPDPQWDRLASFWESAYPPEGLPPEQAALLERLEGTAPELAELLPSHRPPSLRGRSLQEVLPIRSRAVPRLRHLFDSSEGRRDLCGVRPSLALAMLGQARADRRLEASGEASAITNLLSRWALERAVPKGSPTLECHRSASRRAAA